MKRIQEKLKIEEKLKNVREAEKEAAISPSIEDQEDYLPEDHELDPFQVLSKGNAYILFTEPSLKKNCIFQKILIFF